jgi:hypothetical protein
MKSKIQLSKFLLITVFLILISGFVCNFVAFAQTEIAPENKLLPPSEEKFEKATDLIAPWRESGCQISNFKFNEPNCRNIIGQEYINAHIVSIYNENGSIWYRFSLNFKSPDYFYEEMKAGFVPFSIIVKRFGSPDAVILRMVGESKNWYEVEINEETKATKFILRNDPMWAKTKWSHWLYKSDNIFIASDVSKFYDKPDGQIIKDIPIYGNQKVKVNKVEGDWVLVGKYINNRQYEGWIRWRKGRNILVGCIFNENEIPEIKTDDGDK